MHISIRNEDFIRHLKHVPMPARSLATDSPYLLLFTQYVLNVWELQKDYGSSTTMEFVFDEQEGHSEEAFKWWPILKQIAKDAGLERFIGSPPIFGNEKHFPPLQAADLFAWEQRMHYVRNRRLIIPMSRTFARLKSLPSAGTQITEDQIKLLHGAAIRMVGEHVKHFPLTRLLGPGKKERRGRVSRKPPP